MSKTADILRAQPARQHIPAVGRGPEPTMANPRILTRLGQCDCHRPACVPCMVREERRADFKSGDWGQW